VKQKAMRRLELPFHRDNDGTLWITRLAEKQGDWTRHHMRPRSRGGKTENSNLLGLREKVHRKFHDLVGNMTPEEIMVLVGVYMSPPGYITHIRIAQAGTEIVLDQKKMQRLRERGLDSMTMIGFQDMVRNELLRGIYRHRRKRARKSA